MKLLLPFFIALCMVLSAMATPFSLNEEQEWKAYKIKYGKSYKTEEEDKMRMNVFFDHKKLIEEHNNMHANGEKTYKLGINKFADLTSNEFRKMMNGLKGSQKKPSMNLYTPPADETLPKSVDWRTKGAVTPIKDQAQCGSCWAFSATGSLEGQHFLKTGKLVSLSEQNLMDCSIDEGNQGCDGGLMDQAFDYVVSNKGIDTEQSYPYTAEDGYTCKFKKPDVGATATGYKDIPSGDETALQSAVANIGPVSVAIDAGHYSFQLYDSGVYYESGCSPNELDHGVLAIGYGSDNGHDYWLVKNSWGESWGLSGYIKMTRNKNNNCGIASKASYPLV